MVGEIVSVTSDGTKDRPALKTANVGFSMGIAETEIEVAKEMDIILMDDNFSSIVKSIMWGRCGNDVMRANSCSSKSRLTLPPSLSVVLIVASEDETSVFSAVQLFWINIIIDTFAAFALSTDPATEKLLERKPNKSSRLVFNAFVFAQIFNPGQLKTP